MLIISHRGNLNGKNPKMENHPDYIKNAIKSGYAVEIDIWYENNKFILGHDFPQYVIDLDFLINDQLWCHAKNTDALHNLLKNKLHCFWHENDKFTLTSRGIPWCYPNNWIDNGITVIKENQYNIPNNILGVCVDNPVEWVL